MLTILAGYCNSGEIPGSTHLWIEALRLCSEHLILVFDNPPPADLPPDWQEASDLTLAFEHHGEYDFGSYKRGLALAAAKGLLEQAQHVLLCNDSVVGPLGPLEPLLAVMTRSTHEAWGLIQSHQGTPHLQSWFLVLGQEVVMHPTVQRFFADIEKQISRHAVIETYEFGLSRTLLATGFPIRAWIKTNEVLHPHNGLPAGNPCMLPITLVEHGAPVIKRRALRQQSTNAEGFAATFQLIAERNPSLWERLLRESPQRRLWQQSIRIGILLKSDAHVLINQLLGWVNNQPHRHTRLVLPVQNRVLHGQLLRNHRKAIEDGALQLVLVSAHTELIPQWNCAISASQDDWIGLADQGLWHNRLSLHLQTAKILRHPNHAICQGDPPLVRRDWLQSRGGLPEAHTPEQITAAWNQQ